MNMIFEKKLAIPMEVKEMYPLSSRLADVVERRAEELKDIFDGRSELFLLIIGPCSADNEESVLEYIRRLRRVQEQVRDKIFIVPRVYTNKPRTTGDGYKGLLHQPDPTEKPDLFKGIVAIRHLFMRVLEETGFSCADEMLYPENYKYVDDLLAYNAVGARSVENQQHRLTASGLGIPVGMKNPTSGDLEVMMNARGIHSELSLRRPDASPVHLRGQARSGAPCGHRGHQSRQFRKAVSGADPDRERGSSEQEIQSGSRPSGEGPDD